LISAYLLILSTSKQLSLEFSNFKSWFELAHYSAMASLANLKETRKRKVEKEMRKYHERWTFEYFFIENADNRLLCLIAIKL